MRSLGFIIPLLVLLAFGIYVHYCEVKENEEYEEKWRRIRESR